MEFSRFSKGLFGMLIVFAVLAGGVAVGNQYLLFNDIKQVVSQIAVAPPETAQVAIEKIRADLMGVQSRQWTLYLPIIGGLFLILTLFFWGLIRGSARKLAQTFQAKPKKQGAAPAPKPQPAKRDPSVDQRLYLHMVSLLQREGRLVDFLFEDLTPYEDSQIGAAVRPIHESCNRIIRKALAPKPVLDSEEGDQVTVEAGFDPTTIKLTGNVTGEPPFQGVLRHSGWRAAKLELPTLSSSQSPRMIAPAEVELG